jgi:hypothetical protein
MKQGKVRGCVRGCLQAVVILGVLLVLAWAVYWLVTRPPRPVPVAVTPATLKPVGTISDRFLSYNVEMVEVTGGRFWRPYSAGLRKGDDRYEYRPPLDLANPRLRKLAAALGPAYVRFSGTWANATYVGPNGENLGKAPPGFDTVLTAEQWRAAVAFAKAANAEIVTSFATSPGTRDKAGVWQPENAQRFLDLTRSVGGEIAATEFANEPNMIELTQPPKGYTAAAYRRDYGRFYDWLRTASPKTKILAPGTAELGEPTNTISKKLGDRIIYERDQLIAAGQHRPDGLSFHYYGGSSQRCGIPLVGTKKSNALSESWLGGIDRAIRDSAALRDRVAPGAPLWLTETGETACGGNPWAATFIDTFRFTDQLARAARQGVSVFIHNTLSASDYGILDEKTDLPRPNYWAAWLWRTFMGTRVLDAGKGTTGLHVYAHCLRGHPGGVALLAINLDGDDPRTLRIDQPGELFSLRQDPGSAGRAMLNGSPLSLGADDSLPALRGTPVSAGAVRIKPGSINYLAYPKANNAACVIGDT